MTSDKLLAGIDGDLSIILFSAIDKDSREQVIVEIHLQDISQIDMLISALNAAKSIYNTSNYEYEDRDDIST